LDFRQKEFILKSDGNKKIRKEHFENNIVNIYQKHITVEKSNTEVNHCRTSAMGCLKNMLF
jgi:septum formation topological specificity factor MinE